jgi:hypothetical protein
MGCNRQASFVTVPHSANSYFFRLALRQVDEDHPQLAMKAAIIILSLGIAICLGLLGYQQHTYGALYERQTQAIALFQRQYETSLRENQALRAKGEIQSRSQIALAQAQSIAARYRKIFEGQNRAPR